MRRLVWAFAVVHTTLLKISYHGLYVSIVLRRLINAILFCWSATFKYYLTILASDFNQKPYEWASMDTYYLYLSAQLFREIIKRIHHNKHYCKLENFRESLIFTKLRISEVSWKSNPHELAISLCHLLIWVNHALLAIFYVTNASFKAIRENKILAKISEFTVFA